MMRGCDDRMVHVIGDSQSPLQSGDPADLGSTVNGYRLHRPLLPHAPKWSGTRYITQELVSPISYKYQRLLQVFRVSIDLRPVHPLDTVEPL